MMCEREMKQLTPFIGSILGITKLGWRCVNPDDRIRFILFGLFSLHIFDVFTFGLGIRDVILALGINFLCLGPGSPFQLFA